ncbi:polyketide cyclase [Noviherbaspirillum massiliense]|uniref:polyketide cyclase n=1 Tax=Noviherbaspirillum massiliense TaxID=1465823 RepID=UPI0002F7DB67|nr:polyketide cyclase [Noviherbaspirillum massiliense]
MDVLFPSRPLSISIACDPARVYAYVRDPRNLPQWAEGFCKSVRKTEKGWIAETPQGPVTIRFCPDNPCGVLDHFVGIAQGAEIAVPMRVIPNGSGSEVLFTLFRAPDMSAQTFMEDADLVERDLLSLKARLEE